MTHTSLCEVPEGWSGSIRSDDREWSLVFFCRHDGSINYFMYHYPFAMYAIDIGPKGD